MRRHHPKNSVHTGLYIIYTIVLIVLCLAAASCNRPGHYPSGDGTMYSIAPAEEEIPETMFEGEGMNTEEYNRIVENSFKDTWQNPFSTFSIDVDNASYTNVRRYLNDNMLPPVDAVRAEEFVNYFNYRYPDPTCLQPCSHRIKAGCHI